MHGGRPPRAVRAENFQTDILARAAAPMNIDRFKHQHVEILSGIAEMRALSRAGVAHHAEQIAQRVVALSAVIKLHLAAEDHALYPALRRGDDAALAQRAQQFQDEMVTIAQRYLGFSRRWNTAAQLRADPEGFREDANQVLKQVFERMQREDREFYPAIERANIGAVAAGG